ncbi:MAG TPA: ABC transporter permease, partial [Rhodanobacter sp.]|nr:ABC transporter permease [Rhodanobacter sp.]
MNARGQQYDNVVTQSLAQIGNCGLFLLTLLAAIPRSFRYVRETIRQLWFVGAMSLTIIMVCGL